MSKAGAGGPAAGAASLGAGTVLGYCTNVHAGSTLDITVDNLELYAAEVRRRLGLSKMAVGLWLSAEAAAEAMLRCGWLRDRLGELGLEAFTLNGFPFSDFHEPIVKHRVYEPDWADERRLKYTMDLIEVLHRVLPERVEGSISTLPVGWPGAPCRVLNPAQAAENLRKVARKLGRLEAETGRLIHVDLEPEPGCILEKSGDVVRFWEGTLVRGHEDDAVAVYRHLRVCHDICHAAVVFEEQADALGAYEAAGILVGKVQVSSALVARFGATAVAERRGMMDELRRFDERRYLHQTCVRSGTGVQEFEDLGEAVEAAGGEPDGEWRVHFHVPVHMESIGALGTTQGQIAPCVERARGMGVRHFEVETYAWTVLPEGLRPADLGAGIAEEVRWVMSRFGGRG